MPEFECEGCAAKDEEGDFGPDLFHDLIRSWLRRL